MKIQRNKIKHNKCASTFPPGVCGLTLETPLGYHDLQFAAQSKLWMPMRFSKGIWNQTFPYEVKRRPTLGGILKDFSYIFQGQGSGQWGEVLKVQNKVLSLSLQFILLTKNNQKPGIVCFPKWVDN